jgi:hypothetical protein
MKRFKFWTLFLLLLLLPNPGWGVDLSPVEELVEFIVKEKGAIALTEVSFKTDDEVELNFLKWYLKPQKVVRQDRVLTDCVLKKNYLVNILKTDSIYRQLTGERSKRMLDNNGYQVIMFILQSDREPPKDHITLCAAESLHLQGIVGEEGHESWKQRLFAALEANLASGACQRDEQDISCDNI